MKTTIISITVLALCLGLGGGLRQKKFHKLGIHQKSGSGGPVEIVRGGKGGAGECGDQRGGARICAVFCGGGTRRLAGGQQRLPGFPATRRAIRTFRQNRRAVAGTQMAGNHRNLGRVLLLRRGRRKIFRGLCQRHHRLHSAGEHLFWRHGSGPVLDHWNG